MAELPKWPFGFSLDDVTVVGVIDMGGEYEEAGDRVPGVRVTHDPTGIVAVADVLASREGNLRIAFQRLDQRIRRQQRAQGG